MWLRSLNPPALCEATGSRMFHVEPLDSSDQSENFDENEQRGLDAIPPLPHLMEFGSALSSVPLCFFRAKRTSERG